MGIIPKKNAIVDPAQEELKLASLYDEIARAGTNESAIATGRAKISQEQIAYARDRLNEGLDTLQINDLVFSMPRITTPPTVIRVDKKILNYRWNTLRTSGTQKRSSGHSTITISFSLYFVGKQAINDGLRRLLVSFESTPFVYIENSFVRANVLGATTENTIPTTMACSLLSMNVHTVPQLPDVLVADITLLWFNYKPFTPHFFYREKWGEGVSPLQEIDSNKSKVAKVYSEGSTDAEGVGTPKKVADKDKISLDWSPPVKFPEHSQPLRERLNIKMNDFAQLTKETLDSGMVFGYKQYRTLSSAEQAQAMAELLRPGVIRELDKSYFREGSNSGTINLSLQVQAATKLEEMMKALREEVSYDAGPLGPLKFQLVLNDAFRGPGEQKKRRDRKISQGKGHEAARPGRSWHEVGLAFDMSTAPVDTPYEQWAWLVKNGPKFGWYNLGWWKAGRMGITKDEYLFRSRSGAGNYGYNPNALEGQFTQYNKFSERWHFDYRPGQKAARAKYGDKGTCGTGNPVQDIINKELYIQEKSTAVEEVSTKIAEALRQLTNDPGWKADRGSSSSSSLVFSKKSGFQIGSEDKELIPQSISISKQNIVAQLPIVGHEYPTQQYLGATDMSAVVTFIAVGTKKLAELQKMIKILQENSRGSRQAKEAAVIDIKNNVFNLVGFKQGVVEGISVRNIEGTPDTYEVILQLTEHKTTRVPAWRKEKYVDAKRWKVLAEYFYSTYVSGIYNYNPVYSTAAYGSNTSTTHGRAGVNLPISEEYWRQILVPFAIPSKQLIFADELETLWEGAGGNDDLNQFFKTMAKVAGYISQAKAQGKNPSDYDSTLSSDFHQNDLTLRLRNWFIAGKLPFVLFQAGADKANIGAIVNALTDENESTVGITLKTVLVMYTAVLITMRVRGHIPADAVDDLGLGNLLPSDSFVSPVYADEEDYAFIRSMERILELTANQILKTLKEHPMFFRVTFDFDAADSLYRHGLPCYPDLDLPRHPTTKNVLNTDPDYYFFNESTDGAINEIGRDYYNKALTVMQNTLLSMGTHLSMQSYSNDIVSFNKFAINTDTAKAEAAGGGVSDLWKAMTNTAGRLAASVVRENELPLEIEYNVSREKLDNVLDSKPSAKEQVKPFRWNKAGKEITVAKFGANQDDKNKPKKADGRLSKTEDLLFGAWANFKENTYRMSRAFPTFKIYFIEDDIDTDSSRGTGKIKNFDDFYSYSAIKDIRIVRSRKIPADLCVITITNIYGELDSLTFGGDGQKQVEKFDPMKADTKYEDTISKKFTTENPFAKLAIIEGSKVQVRLGYSNNPSNLETVFNGQVVEVGMPNGTPDILQIVCQSYVAELVSEVKGTSGSKEEYDSTQELLSTMICSPEVTHFGRWSQNALYQTGEIRNKRSDSHAKGWFDKKIDEVKNWALKKWEFLNKPQDDNIYAPNYDTYGDIIGQISDSANWLGIEWAVGGLAGCLKDNRKYHPFHVTIWDIFKEMELRHPGFVASPVPYGQRYTMFFGPPNHKYWARPLKWHEQVSLDSLDRMVNHYYNSENRQDKQYRAFAKGFPSSAVEDYIKEKYHEKLSTERIGDLGRHKPFRQHWMLTSEHHIIANNIRASSHGTFNAVDLTYFDDAKGADLQTASAPIGGAIGAGLSPGQAQAHASRIINKAIDSNAETLKMKADDNIEDKDTRIMKAEYYSCYGSYFARRYAVGLLIQSLKDTYKGELIITGNASIKPYDVCFIYDSYSDIFGPVEVEQVTHILSQEQGFITEIKPDLCITFNDWSTQATTDAMWQLGVQFSQTLGSYMTSAENTSVQTAVGGVAGTAVIAGLTGGVGIIAALWGGYKIIQWTQERQPLVISPLIHRHKPLIAGLNGYKHDNLILNFGGKWKRFTKELDTGWSAFWENEEITEFIHQQGVGWLD